MHICVQSHGGVMRNRLMASLAVLTALALAFSGCSGKGGDGASTTTSTSQSSSTSPSATPSPSSSSSSASSSSSSSTGGPANHPPAGSLSVLVNGTTAKFTLTASDADGDAPPGFLFFG